MMNEVQIQQFYKSQECNGGSYSVKKWQEDQTEGVMINSLKTVSLHKLVTQDVHCV